ncbi:MAG: DUF362 domain-containing protein [Clostridia bacterium]|nr:DUF362 domain-containing protein [Clostridia bacterium]
MTPIVYMTNHLTPEAVIRVYDALGVHLDGRVAIKVHSGEAGNQNFLRPGFCRPIIEHIGGTVVECNTAYEGARNTTKKHRKLFETHGWSRMFPVDLLDAEGPDVALPIVGGRILKETYVGRGLLNYDSMLVLSHFKGHPMGGFGGALKQLSIGCASSAGKSHIHSAGVTQDMTKVWDMTAPQDDFLASMAEAAKAVTDHFDGRIAYVSLVCNLSVDCDCCAVAEDPCMKDIGILASLDPVALDRACMDLIYASTDPGRDHFLQRVESRHGTYTIEVAEALGVGSQTYELRKIDN